MMEKFEAAEKAMGQNILLNAFDVTRRTLVITDASAEGFRHILMQKKNKSEVQVKAQAVNRKGVITKDTGWVVIQVGSAALKTAWRNYSTLELEAICVVWSLETLANYLKGCLLFDLWNDHSPLAQAMKKEGPIRNRLWILGRSIRNGLCILRGPIRKPIRNRM